MTATSPGVGDAQPPAKRMTLSHVVEHLLNRGSAKSSSVTLTRNAKGETQIEVVITTDAELDMPTPTHAADVAEAIYDRLRAKYPTLGEQGSAKGAA